MFVFLLLVSGVVTYVLYSLGVRSKRGLLGLAGVALVAGALMGAVAGAGSLLWQLLILHKI